MKPIKIILLSLLSCLCLHTFGQAWETSNGAYASSRFDDVSFINETTGFTAQDGKIFKTTDQGRNWDIQGELGSENTYIRSVHFFDDSTGYIGILPGGAGNKYLFRTRNGGQSFEEVGNTIDGKRIYGICGLDFKDGLFIGVGIYAGPANLYKSIDKGENWTLISIDSLASGLVDCLVLDRDNILVVGISKSNQGIILRSGDGGNTWMVVAVADDDQSYCWKLTMDASGIGFASIEFSNSILKTLDFGKTWERIEVAENDEHFGGILFLNDSLGWVGNQWGNGIWETNDGGVSWSKLEQTYINVNKIVQVNENIAVAAGQRMYIYDRNKLSTDRPKILESKAFHKFTVSPNPTSNVLNIDLNIAFTTHARIDLLTMGGKILKSITQQRYAPGSHSQSMDVSDLPAGQYNLWFRSHDGHMNVKVQIL